MTKTSKLIMLLNHISTGFLAPVLSLMLLQKGSSMSGLAALMGIYSFTVLALELPTGIIADLFGRKLSFILSMAATAVAVCLPLIGGGFPLLCCSMAVFGAGRALASGSMDALLIDQSIAQHGEESIAKVTTQLALLETIGIAAGTLIGGVLPVLSQRYLPLMGRYDLNLLARVIFCLITGLLTLVFVSEAKTPGAKPAPGLKAHLLESCRILRHSRMLALLVLGTFCIGFMLTTIETYWQPAFAHLLRSQSLLWLTGPLSFGCFGFASVGSYAAGRVLQAAGRSNTKKRLPVQLYYNISRLALAAVVVLFALQGGAVAFALLFFAVYLLLGASNIAEGTLFNKEIPGEKRASILSLVSLIAQLGGLCASAAGSVTVKFANISALWLGTGVLMLAVSAVIALLMRGHAPGRKNQPVAKEDENEPASTAV